MMMARGDLPGELGHVEQDDVEALASQGCGGVAAAGASTDNKDLGTLHDASEARRKRQADAHAPRGYQRPWSGQMTDRLAWQRSAVENQRGCLTVCVDRRSGGSAGTQVDVVVAVLAVLAGAVAAYGWWSDDGVGCSRVAPRWQLVHLGQPARRWL